MEKSTKYWGFNPFPGQLWVKIQPHVPALSLGFFGAVVAFGLSLFVQQNLRDLMNI